MRELGTRSYCGQHLTELYLAFDPSVFEMNGRGLQSGPARPDWGPEFADLRCCACGAGWTGPIGEACWWCRRHREILLEHSARLVMQPPDVDPQDRTYRPRMEGWAHRLANAVKAGVITRDEADRAWRHAVGKAAA